MGAGSARTQMSDRHAGSPAGRKAHILGYRLGGAFLPLPAKSTMNIEAF